MFRVLGIYNFAKTMEKLWIGLVKASVQQSSLSSHLDEKETISGLSESNMVR